MGEKSRVIQVSDPSERRPFTENIRGSVPSRKYDHIPRWSADRVPGRGPLIGELKVPYKDLITQ